MKKIKKALVFTTALALMVTSLAGCGGKKSGTSADLSNEAALTENTMPITEEDVEISIYLDNRSRGALDSYNNSQAMQELQKRTGLKIKFDHPVDTSTDKVSLMIASGNLPDVLFTSTYFYGAWKNSQVKQAAYKGMFLKLDEYVDKFAPNIKKFFAENPDAEASYRMFNPDNGMYTTPVVYNDRAYNYYDGYFIRKDWLDKLGLEVPDTIEDWENVLRAFVNGDPNGNGEKDEVGFSSFAYMTKFVFMPAFDVFNWNYYLNPDTNKITHGVVEPGMKDFLKMMNRWYDEGLVNPEYVTTDQKTLDYLVMNNKLGAFYCDYNNTAIKYVEANPDMELIPVPMVANAKGQRRTGKIGKSLTSGYGGLISSKSPYAKEIVRLFDYLFSEEGVELLNWGVEGESYTKDANGNKTFTELITKNPDGKSVVEAYNAYTASGVNGGLAGIYDHAVNKALNSSISAKQKALQDKATEYCEQVEKSANMPSTPTTVEEDKEITDLSGDLNTYIGENFSKFMTGARDIEEYEDFVKEVKKMGMDRILEIRQGAYERGLKSVESLLK